MSGVVRRRRVVRVLGRLAVVLVAVLLGAIAAEALLPVPAGLRGAIWRQARGSLEEHEPGKLRTVANFRGVQTVGGGRQLVRHDALGMRGTDFGPKQPGELRVVFLGDSVTYGTGVQEEETFAKRLEPLLAAQLGTPVRCGIAASPGFGVRDQAPFLRRVQADFAPDLVVSCVFVENDLYDDLQLERGVFAGYPVFQARQVRLLRSSWRARLAARFTLAYLIEQLLAEHVPAWAMPLDGARLSPQEEELWAHVAPDQSALFLEQVGGAANTDDPSGPRPGTLQVVERLVERSADGLRELQRTAGDVPVVVVLVPSYVQYLPGLFEHLAAARTGELTHRRGAIQARLARAAAALDLPCFDLLPPLLAHPDPASLLIPNDFHFTPAGHRFVAEVLAPWLADQLVR